MLPLIEHVPTASFLIFEGADGVGKTTLAQACSRQRRWRYAHHEYQPDETDLYGLYWSELTQCTRVAIDRSFISELVYGPILRDGSRLSLAQAEALAREVSRRDGVFVHVTAAPEAVRQRLDRREGRALALEHITALLGAYENVFESLATVGTVTRIDTS